MSSIQIRRWLQPSPVLRWHPWAPLACIALGLAFAFMFGWWLSSLYSRSLHRGEAAGTAWVAKLATDSTKPARSAMFLAAQFDNAVMAWNRAQEARPTGPERAMTWLADVVTIRMLPTQRIEFLRSLAEYRLASLSGDAPQWRVTANLCAEVPGISGGRDLREAYESTALAYSRLLERSVRADDLAPAVVGYRCPAARH